VNCQAASSVSVVGQHTDATEQPFERCREVLAKAAVEATGDHKRGQVEVLTAMLPDLSKRPSQTRLREMAGLMGEPQKVKGANLSMDQLFRNVQKAFVSLVLEGGGCDASRSGGPHPSAHASSGASSSGGPHPSEDVLPALDKCILGAIHELGRYPKELNTTSSEEDKAEQKLAQKIRQRWEALLPETRSRLLELERKQDLEAESEYPLISEINDLMMKICPRVPEHMVPEASFVLSKLHLVKEIRSREVLKKHAGGTQWWKDAGVVENPTIRKASTAGKSSRGKVPAISMQYNLGFVAAQEAKAFLDKLLAYYESDDADAYAWLHYHTYWKIQLDAGSEEQLSEDVRLHFRTQAVELLTSGYPGPLTKHVLASSSHGGLILVDPGWGPLSPGELTITGQ